MTTKEQDLAIREAHRNVAEDRYFAARAWESSAGWQVHAFRAGFDAAWSDAQAPLIARIAELEAGLEARLQGSERMSETIATLERKLAPQRDVEPDAWLYLMPLGCRVLENTRLDHFHPDGKGGYVKGAPLHLHPAPKQVPLTDEQIANLYIDGVRHWIGKASVVRAVEAAHGITGETK